MVARDLEGEVEFRLHNPSARQVYLVGDFNGWQECSLPMTRQQSGEWVCRLHLPEGVYQYKYLVDGEWCLDSDPVGIGWAPFGCNSVMVMHTGDVPAFPVG